MRRMARGILVSAIAVVVACGWACRGEQRAKGPTAPSNDGLDSRQVQEVVAARKSSLSPKCWPPTLDTREKDAPTPRIVVTVVVNPNGEVRSATPSAASVEYPDLSNCVVAEIKSWRFPTSAGATTVIIPFAFAEQPTAPANGGLEPGQVQEVVAAHRDSLKPTCWQPALDTRAEGAPTTARIVVTIVVDPNGEVRSATSSTAASEYPGLAICLISRVKNWRFPASARVTTVNIPFVFDAR
jgi:hypothetical protein